MYGGRAEQGLDCEEGCGCSEGCARRVNGFVRSYVDTKIHTTKHVIHPKCEMLLH